MLALLLFACDTTITSTSQSCEVDLISLTPAQVVPGDTVTLTAVPLTEAWDTAIRVGGLEAEVLAVTREGCDDCDVCQAEQDALAARTTAMPATPPATPASRPPPSASETFKPLSSFPKVESFCSSCRRLKSVASPNRVPTRCRNSIVTTPQTPSGTRPALS